jgi:carbon starvation protein
MTTLLIALASFAGFFIAYHTYGKWLGSKIFDLDDSRVVPSISQQDGVDFVPTNCSIVFGHHFTSIAGTGPIVGPALAVFWGWLPALIWVLLGSIFIGAVHDLGALVVSLRHNGQTIGEIAGRMISPRAKLLFLVTLFFSLTVVLGIFGLVIASIFGAYPESVLPVWVSLPVAIWIGLMVKRGSRHLLPMSLLSLVLIYFCVYLGAYHFPIALNFSSLDGEAANWINSNTVWTGILLVYCGIASVLPVWLLLQPRDYVNSLQLLAALALLVIGLVVACCSGGADLIASAPAVVADPPADAPPILPFLFITIACGAISGFHCLVSSGTSSKQLKKETDAVAVGYGSMLLEGALAVIVILACCAGVGMGEFQRTQTADGSVAYVATANADGTALTGRPAWESRYGAGKAWKEFRLKDMVGAFIFGGANFLTQIGIPMKMAIGIIAVLVGSFAATTLDSATRLQRYVIQELGQTIHVPPLTNRYVATIVAVVLGGLIAMQPNADGLRGAGGIMLWPLFGATNQLLAGLAFMVILFFLWRRGKPIWFVAIPMGFMLLMPAIALLIQLFDPTIGWVANFENKKLLAIIGLITFGIQIWMLVEGWMAWSHAKGVIEPAAPPHAGSSNGASTNGESATVNEGGRSC